jgi:hypothetical protein
MPVDATKAVVHRLGRAASGIVARLRPSLLLETVRRRKRWALACAMAMALAVGATVWTQRRQAVEVDAAQQLLSTRFSDWTSDYYAHGALRAASQGLVIGASRPPGGLYFHHALDPAQRYVLALLGNRLSGSANLRVRADSGEYTWFGVPEGEAAYLTPPGARDLEVLIYADTPFQYNLSKLVVLAASAGQKGDAWASVAPPNLGSVGIQSVLPGWSAELYVNPEVQKSGPNLRIRGRAVPAGVFFRRELSSDRPYRLALTGRAIGKDPVLRLKVDDGPYSWNAIHDGGAEVVLPRGSKVEALIYADEPFDYELHSLSVIRCETCLTDSELKALIIKEAHLAQDDPPLVRARKLRNWVANTVVLGPEAGIMNTVTEAIVSEQPSQVYSDYFQPRRGGVSCGGMAAYLARIYQLFGMKAFWIDIGYKGTALTHVTTILSLGDREHPKFYVFDPTLSGTYTRGGAVIDLDRALASPSQARFETDEITRTVLVAKSEFRAFLHDNATAKTGATCDRDSALPYTLECRGFHHNVAYNLLMMRRVMEQNNFPPERDFILGLLANHLISIGPGDLDHATRDAFLRLMDAHRVPHDAGS